MKNTFKNAGFTLIELLVVMLILGVLAALVVPKVIGRGDDAKVTAAKTDVAQIKSALKLYYLDNQRYPTTEQGLAALTTKPSAAPLPAAWKQGGYLDKLPNDPWGKPYLYLSPGVRAEVDVFSYGSDGIAGGEGNNADIFE
jgi:general secretion pathway protein G